MAGYGIGSVQYVISLSLSLPTSLSTAVDDLPIITTQPQNQRNVIPGSNVTFSVNATGLNLTYSWEEGDGSALPSDSRFVPNNETLSIQNVMPSDVGSYRCVVSNDAGSDTSIAANLTLMSEFYMWTGILPL